MNIAEFKKKNQPKKVSTLKKFESEILELYSDGYSLKTIAQFLKENGIKTTFQNVSKFIKKSDMNIFQSTKEILKDKNEKVQITNKSSVMPKLERIGKDLEMKEAPEWAK